MFIAYGYDETMDRVLAIAVEDGRSSRFAE